MTAEPIAQVHELSDEEHVRRVREKVRNSPVGHALMLLADELGLRHEFRREMRERLLEAEQIEFAHYFGKTAKESRLLQDREGRPA
jgi:hypothetical protein